MSRTHFVTLMKIVIRSSNAIIMLKWSSKTKLMAYASILDYLSDDVTEFTLYLLFFLIRLGFLLYISIYKYFLFKLFLLCIDEWPLQLLHIIEGGILWDWFVGVTEIKINHYIRIEKRISVFTVVLWPIILRRDWTHFVFVLKETNNYFWWIRFIIIHLFSSNRLSIIYKGTIYCLLLGCYWFLLSEILLVL